MLMPNAEATILTLGLEFEAHWKIEQTAWCNVASCPTPSAILAARETSAQTRELAVRILETPAASLKALKVKSRVICWALADDAPELLQEKKIPAPLHLRAAQSIIDDLLRL